MRLSSEGGLGWAGAEWVPILCHRSRAYAGAGTDIHLPCACKRPPPPRALRGFCLPVLPDSYILEVTGPGLSPALFDDTVPGFVTSYTVGGLTPGGNYTVQLQAFSCSGASAVATCTGTPSGSLPGPPLPLGVTVGVTTAILTWAAPPNLNSTANLMYSVGVSSVGGAGVPPPVLTNLPCCTAQLSRLTPNSTYVFNVSASSAAGAGPAALFPPAAPGVGLPSAPCNVSASSPSANALLVGWAQVTPAGDGGSPLQAYLVRVYPASAGPSPGPNDTLATLTVPGTNTSAWVQGLPLNVSLVVTVAGVSARGEGRPSGLSPPVVSQPDPPSPPTNPYAYAFPSADSLCGAQVAVTVSWDVPVYAGGVGLVVAWYNVFNVSRPPLPTTHAVATVEGAESLLAARAPPP